MTSTLLDLSRYLGGIGVLIYVASVITSRGEFLTIRFDWGSWWLLDVGRAFWAEANWLLPTFLAIVLAFYAALIGQSVANTPPEDVLRTRRRLVPAGLMLASLVLAFLGTAILVAFDSPSQWPRVPGLVVVSVAISMLGIGVGRFESRSLQIQLESAKRMLRMREVRRGNLPEDFLPAGTVRPVIVLCVTVLTAVTLTTAPIFIALLVEGAPLWSAIKVTLPILALSSIWVVLGFGFPFVLIQSSYGDSRRWRASKQALAAVLTVFLAGNAFIFGLPAVIAATSSSDVAIGVLIFVVPSVTVWVLSLASLFVGSRRMHPKLVALTLRAAIVDLSRRELEKDIARLQDEVAALEPPVVMETSESRDSRLKQILQLLRPRGESGTQLGP